MTGSWPAQHRRDRRRHAAMNPRITTKRNTALRNGIMATDLIPKDTGASLLFGRADKENGSAGFATLPSARLRTGATVQCHCARLQTRHIGPGVAIPAGLEPATRGVEIRYSIQLSYGTGAPSYHLRPGRDNTVPGCATIPGSSERKGAPGRSPASGQATSSECVMCPPVSGSAVPERCPADAAFRRLSAPHSVPG